MTIAQGSKQWLRKGMRPCAVLLFLAVLLAPGGGGDIGSHSGAAVGGNSAGRSGMMMARAAGNDVPDDSCPLECKNGSTCKAGSASFDGQPLNRNNKPLPVNEVATVQGHYCECPAGFTGVDCATVYTPCDDGNSTHACYNHGVCVEFKDSSGSSSNFQCDCSSAVNADDIPYAGKYCADPATVECKSSVAQLNPKLRFRGFCMNGGTCGGNNLSPCSCPQDYWGIHCEYEKTEFSECNLECQNGATCQIGVPPTKGSDVYDYWKHYHTDQFAYCQCASGNAGLFCEASEVSCGDSGVDCFHGSTCVAGSDSGEYFCDCNEANKLNNGIYAGRFCQYEATAICGRNHNGKNFCVNGGKCVHTGNGIFSCACPDNFHGPNCEFPDDQPDNDEEYEGCNLVCDNGGQCRKGSKQPVQITLTDVSPEVRKAIARHHNDDFEHCVCPTGYTGLTCELEADDCGNGEHMCLHGSKCVQGAAGTWSCDCAEAFTAERKVAGTFCQHHHTSTCTPDNQPTIYSGPTSFAFCVNDGICADIVVDGESHPGCDCPDGYVGRHCELLAAEHPKYRPIQPESDSGDGVSAFMYVAVILASMLLFASLLFLRQLKIRDQKRQEILARSRIDHRATTKNNEIHIEEEFDEIELS